MRLEDVASLSGYSLQYLSRLERADRRLNVEVAQAIAGALRCSVSDLLGQGEAKTVLIVGSIESDEAVLSPASGDERVTPPPGAEGTSAIRIAGDSMWPVYHPGDLLFFEPSNGVFESAIGHECVCTLKDGRRLLKTVHKSERGYRLSSYKHREIDVSDLVSAAKIKWIIRA
jgi:transcriptional regulator with XRE-family HTH domain